MNQSYQQAVKELDVRHKTAAMFVGASLGLSVALIGIAFTFGERFFRYSENTYSIAVWTFIVILAIGVLVLKRMRFAASRLYDISILRGAGGMLKDMQSTTITIASLGGAIALLGFIVMIQSGDKYQMLRAGLVAIFVLLYSYPQKSAWLRVLQWLEKKNSASDQLE